MTTKNPTIRLLATGVAGLDELLGGGMPEYSFNLIAGSPGAGKTTLAHQMMFALANPERRAIFFTVLGEPPLKMLRYQQQFTFFDIEKVNDSVKFVNLASDLLDGDFNQVLAHIVAEVENFSPGLVFVDSFRSVVQSAKIVNASGTFGLQQFIQQLAMHMTSWQATTFLIGEYPVQEEESGPVFTVADGLLWLSQNVHRDAMVRKLQVVKVRSQAQRPGLHSFRITDAGIEVFPRAIMKSDSTGEDPSPGNLRLNMGAPLLDEMMGGGLPVGYSLLVVGPTGSGKSVLATEFLAEGVRQGEPGVIAAFEKSPNQLLSHRLQELVNSGQVGVIYTRSLDLSIDETLHDLVQLIKKLKARRVVIDSRSGFELALSAVFRENFRESLYRLVAALTSMGVTVLMTAELEDRYTDLRFSSYGNALLTDSILMLRYVELAGCFRRVVSVVKLRGSPHSKEIRFFDIENDSIVIGEALSDYHSILSGHPQLAEGPNRAGGPAVAGERMACGFAGHLLDVEAALSIVRLSRCGGVNLTCGRRHPSCDARQPDGKHRAGRFARFDGDFSAVRLGDFAGDKQPQAHAARWRAPCLLVSDRQLNHRVENRPQRHGRNDRSKIADIDDDCVRVATGVDGDRLAARAVLHRVVEQVRKHLLQPRRVEHAAQIPRTNELEGAARMAGLRVVERGLGYFAQVGLIQGERNLPAELASGVFKQIVDHRCHVRGTSRNAGAHVPRFGRADGGPRQVIGRQ